MELQPCDVIFFFNLFSIASLPADSVIGNTVAYSSPQLADINYVS